MKQFKYLVILQVNTIEKQTASSYYVYQLVNILDSDRSISYIVHDELIYKNCGREGQICKRKSRKALTLRDGFVARITSLMDTRWKMSVAAGSVASWRVLRL